MVVVGGPGYFLGPVLGSAVGVVLPEWLRFAQAWYLFIFGLAVILLMIWLPDGLLSIPDRMKAKKLAKDASDARSLLAKQTQEKMQRENSDPNNQSVSSSVTEVRS